MIDRFLPINDRCVYFWYANTDMEPQCSYHYMSYAETGYFSQLIADYESGSEHLRDFYVYTPDDKGIADAVTKRSHYHINRKLLVETLLRQYEGLETDEPVKANIASLADEHTFTVTTAHQPNLLTGYLYFVYKIIHAIKLAEQLNDKYIDRKFVPVYYMGSEDNDLAELGTFRFRGEKYVWDGAGQQGAVGRMSTAGLQPLLARLLHDFGPPGIDCDNLTDVIKEAYGKKRTIGEATRYLVNELFGRYGLVVIDPDDRELKRTFIPVMEDDLMKGSAAPIVSEQTVKLTERYKAQAYPRPINLFYLHDQLRERIEKQGEHWIVINTDISFSQDELIKELYQFPERFSPNVVLRGLFQSTILPDVAFIGGGAEVAYWFQLKTLFEYYNVPYPVILQRQSVLWIGAREHRLREQCALSVQEIFTETAVLEKRLVTAAAGAFIDTTAEKKAIETTMQQLRTRAVTVDKTLAAATDAVIARIERQLANLDKKMLRAEKKKHDVALSRIYRLREKLFPNDSLQERIENFAEYYLENGPAFFDIIKNGIQPLGGRFLIIER